MNEKKMFLLPYTERDGIRTVPDSGIKELFERTVSDGSDKIVFYAGTIRDAEQFLCMAKRTDTLFYLLMIGSEVIGYFWLNRFENKGARFHFCTFKEYWGQNVDIGTWTLKEVLSWQDICGKYHLLDLLTGYVPVWNERAIKFSLKCGGKSAGVIPNAIWHEETQKSEDAVFIYYTRGAE
jgi:hypothetical protein